MTAHVLPTAVYRKIPAADRQAPISPRAIILHSAAGKGSLYNWWLTNPLGLESHLWVAESGRIEQYVPFNVRAVANGQANAFAVSVETESSITATEPWTPAQLDAIVTACDWVCRRYGIPRRLMTHPTDTGIAWHVQFGAPGPWTTARGKTCPGPARIRQVQSVVIPRLQALATGTAKPAKPAPSPSKPPTSGGLTMSDINTIMKELREIKGSMARRAFAVRDPRDKSVWVVAQDGTRHHLPNPGGQTVALLTYIGVLDANKVHTISAEHLDLIPKA